jgi:hypothetical protein
MDPLLNVFVKLPHQYGTISCPSVKQRLRLLQVGGVKAVGEPAAVLCQERASLVAPAPS